MRAVPVRSLSVLCTFFVFAMLPGAASAASESEVDAAIAKALAYAPSQHDATTGEPPAYEHTGFYSGEWLASGYAAAGLSAADVGAGGDPSFQDFLFGEAASFWDGLFLIAPEYTGRLILTASAAGIDTARVSATQNLPAELIGHWSPLGGGFAEPNTFSTAWGVLALRTTPLPAWALQPALTYLRADQHPDGGWSFFRVEQGEESNPDITAATVGALCTAGVPAYDPTVIDGLAYLRGLQVKETGAIYNPEFGENVDTSSWTVNALNSCSVDPQSSEWTSADGKTPVDHILSLQLEDGGFAWTTGEPWFPPSTGHALRALAGDGFTAGPPSRQNPALPNVRPAPAVAAGTPVPHVLAIELAPGNVRLCNVTAPAGAPLSVLLDAAKASSLPASCVTSFSVAGDVITEVNGVTPAADESWLVRLDRGIASVAAARPVGFGEVVSLRVGPTPPTISGAVSTNSADAAGPAGQPGRSGKRGQRGKRGPRGKPGRNATITCRARKRRTGKQGFRCTVRHQSRAKRNE